MWCDIITSIFGALILAITMLSLKGRRKRILADKIPGPNGSIITGNLTMFTQGPEMFVKNMLREYRIYENTLYKYWIFNRLYIVLTRPEDIEKVLNSSKCLKKSADYMILQDSVGKGIIANENIDEWRHNRKLVIKGFGPARLKSLIPIFYQEAKVLVEIILEKYCLKSKDCDVIKPISKASMEVIGKTTLGVTLNAQLNKQNKLYETIQTVLNILNYRIINPWFINNVLFHLSPVKREYDRCLKFGNDFIDEIIKSKISVSNHIENSTQVNKGDENIYRMPITHLEILLQNSNVMSLKQIRDEILTICIAGQDTSSTTNALTIFMLAHHQDVQNKVFEELQSIFLSGDYERQPTFEDLQQMNYLERVIKETLRLFPSAPMIGRSLEEDMEIGGYLCPAGASLIVCPMFLQTSPSYYTDPNKFNPDNFLPDACATRHPYAYIPFSGGLRNCVGGKYAMLQLKTILSTLVRKLKFLPSDRCPKPENLRLVFPITLKLVGGCHVKIESRF